MKDLIEFPDASWEEWKKRVTSELGDSPFESIEWKTGLGFTLEPCYPGLAGNPTPSGDKTRVCVLHQDIPEGEIHVVNQLIRESLTGGTSSIGIRNKIHSKDELVQLLRDVQFEIIEIHFTHAENSPELLTWMNEMKKEIKAENDAWKGSLGWDYLNSGEQAIPGLLTLQKSLADHPGIKLFPVDAALVHEKGGNAVHELAWATSAGNEYMHQLITLGLSAQQAAHLISFELASGGSFFIELSKFKTLRKLWDRILKGYDTTADVHIHATTSSFLQSARALHNNLLRGTTQAMSAVLGGANAIEIIPFDHSVKEKHSDASRWSRNIYHLLMQESFFHSYKNAADGSVYVDVISSQLEDEAWNLFLKIEEKGGFVEGRNDLEKMISNERSESVRRLKDGERIMVGVNKFEDRTEKNPAGTANRLSAIIEHSPVIRA